MVLRGIVAGVLTVGALSLVTPATGLGATTFGADLETAPTGGLSNVTPFTSAHRALAPSEQAAGGAVAPSDGVVVRWRIRTVADSMDPPSGTGWTAAPRLIRDNLSVGRGTPVTVADVGGIQTFPTQLPVQAGDRLGIDTPGGEGDVAYMQGGSVADAWSPPLGATEMRPPTTAGPVVLTINADVEPDADRDGFGDETQDGCPTDASAQGPCPDRVDPATTIVRKPPKKSTFRKATIEFISDEAAATFECALDSPEYTPCSSPLKLKRLKRGKHAFGVRAVDAAGNVDTSAAIVRFKVTRRRR